MKRFILVVALLLAVCLTGTAFADVYVRGYTKSNGTYVQPHYRSSPNGTTADNWSTKGNVNPYTGQYGTKSPTYPSAPSYNPYPTTYGTVSGQYEYDSGYGY